MLLKLIAFASLVLPQAIGQPASAATEAVKQVLASYRKADAITARIGKTIYQAWKDDETTSVGDFYFSKGKMRMDLDELGERVLLVYDGKIVWVETPFDATKVVVQKVKIEQVRKGDSVLAALFSGKDVLKDFNLKDTKKVDGKEIYIFGPKDKKATQLTELQISVHDKEIERITYLDQMENKVSFTFKDVKKGKVSADKFKYVPPSGAEVSEL